MTMTTLHMLTVRTNAALGRFSTLQKRAESVAPSPNVVRSALKELNECLEELQVANEELHRQVEAAAALNLHSQEKEAQYEEFRGAVPIACVFTASTGDIEDANPAAANLLNVTAPHLEGRSLALFTTDRVKFKEALGALNAGLMEVVELENVLRPREKRPRPVRFVGRRLEHDRRVCWFLHEESSSPDLHLRDRALQPAGAHRPRRRPPIPASSAQASDD